MLTSDTEFQYFHAYENLARQALAEPLSCECGSQQVTVHRKGALALWCPNDDSFTVPGFSTRMKVEEVVETFKEKNV